MYRSKTPTADLYSSRDKESLHVNRPKTPLVDTRHWPKSQGMQSNSDQNERTNYNQISKNNDVLNQSDNMRLQSMQDSRRHVGDRMPENIANRPTGFSNNWKMDQPPLKTGYSATLDKTSVNPSWYTTLGKLRDTYWSENNKDMNKPSDFGSNSQSSDVLDNGHSSQYGYSQSKLPPPVPPHSRTNFNDSYDDNVFTSHGSGNHPWTNKGAPDNASTRDYGMDWNSSVYNQGLPNDTSYRRTNSMRSNGPYNQPPIHYGPVSGPNDSVSHHEPTYRTLSSSSVPSGHSPSNSHYDSLTRRKRSTSFEHEHPSPMNKSENMYPVNSMYSQQGTVLRAPMLNRGSEFVDMTVTLLRQESGFGFRIVGGTEEGSQVI